MTTRNEEGEVALEIPPYCPLTDYRRCYGEECALWLEFEGECSIRTIARALWFIGVCHRKQI